MWAGTDTQNTRAPGASGQYTHIVLLRRTRAFFVTIETIETRQITRR